MLSKNYINDRSHIFIYNRALLIMIFNALALSFLLQGCSSENLPELVNQKTQAVLLNEVEVSTYYQEFRFSGITQTENRAQLSFGVSGKVQEVLVDIGSRLKAGEVMATLDLEPFELALNTTHSEASKIQASLDEFQANYERQSRLRSNNAISQQDLEASRTLFLTAQASLREANSRIRLAERDLSQAVIRAPYDGIVSTRQVNPFEEVAQTQIIFTFDSTEKLIVESSVPVSLATELRYTNEQTITIIHNGKSFGASVSHIAERASNGLSLPIKLRLQIPDDHFLPPGVVVEVNYLLKNRESFLLVPHGSIYVEATNNSAFIYLYDSESRRVSKRPVQIVDNQATGYWVRSTLKPGDRYVAAGAAFISEGQLVRVVEEKH